MQSLNTENTFYGSLTDPKNLAPVQAAWEGLRNYSTCYEVVLFDSSTGRAFRVGYTPRKTQPGLIASVRSNWDEIESVTGPREWRYGKKSSDPLTSGSWSIRFSGRTERDCKTMRQSLKWVGSK